MLVLTRKKGEAIHIGDGITLKVLRLSSGSVRLGIEAPDEVSVKRAELAQPGLSSRQASDRYGPHHRGATRRRAASRQPSDQDSPKKRRSSSVSRCCRTCDSH
jgi:carbon storage regulator